MQLSRRGQTGLGVFAVLVIGAIALVVLSIMLLLGMQLVGQTAGNLGETGGVTNESASPNPVTGSAVSFEDTSGASEVSQVYQVNDSTGYAIRLTGYSDSYYESQQDVDLSADETWSVTTWARVNDSVSSENMTAVSANGRAMIQYNGSSDQWIGWYYDDGTLNSYRLTTSAPDQPNNLTLITFTHNQTHLKLYRNTTLAATQNVSVSAIEDPEINATNWDGTLEETRVFDDATNDSEQSELYNNPVAPRPDRNRTARLMFDEGSGSTTAIYFTGTRADIYNFSWVHGHDGNILNEGTDYELSESDGTITALGGGKIDGAPVVWIDYEYKALDDVGNLGNSMRRAYSLFGQAVIIIPGVAVLAVLVTGLLAATRLSARMSTDTFDTEDR